MITWEPPEQKLITIGLEYPEAHYVLSLWTARQTYHENSNKLRKDKKSRKRLQDDEICWKLKYIFPYSVLPIVFKKYEEWFAKSITFNWTSERTHTGLPVGCAIDIQTQETL